MRKNIFTHAASLLLCLFASLTAQAQAEQDICVFKNGEIIFKAEANAVDSVAAEEGKSILSLYKQGTQVYTTEYTNVDSVVYINHPVADMLDVVFRYDGTAYDQSPMGMNVEKVGSTSITYWNSTYQRYVANFNNPWAGNATGYYKVDYASNAAFQNMLMAGHTIEALIMADYSGDIADAECKPFSSHQAGGTGFLITRKANGTGGQQNDICFLPHTGGSYRWAISGVAPSAKVYYHIVGVYDKNAQKALIYVNGEKKGEVSATGNLKLASAGNLWFAIGGDPNDNNTANSAWNGDVVLARIYSSALDAKQVSNLWNEVNELQQNAEEEWITDVKYNREYPVMRGADFAINGVGFQENDQIVLRNPASNNDVVSVQNVTLAQQGIHFRLPDDLNSGTYLMYIRRGDAEQYLGTQYFDIMTTAPTHAARVIAHRGYWTKLANNTQNSRESLNAALSGHFYGSETDVWITMDRVLMVNHDPSLGGVTIQKATSKQCKNVSLSNGEKMPTLEEFLDILKESDSPTKLIIEIKTHSLASKSSLAAQYAVQMVKDKGLQDRVEYIAFSMEACKAVAEADPEAKIAYLNGDKSPAELHAVGVTGLDYTLGALRAHPTWIEEAHQLGMTVNVWTIDSVGEMIECNRMGADYITTNYPEEAEAVKCYFEELMQTGK